MAYRKVGHIYILESSKNGTIKIGRSATPKKRLDALKTITNSFGRVWISPIQTDSFFLEKSAHSLFSHHREYGEWFNASYEDAVKQISELLKPSPTNSELDKLRDDYNKKCDEMHDAFSKKIDLVIPSKDDEWVKAVSLAKVAGEMISMCMVRMAFLDQQEKLCGLSLFTLSFAILIYGKDDFFIACLMSDCSDVLNSSSTDELLSFIENEIIEPAKLIYGNAKA